MSTRKQDLSTVLRSLIEMDTRISLSRRHIRDLEETIQELEYRARSSRELLEKYIAAKIEEEAAKVPIVGD